MNTKQFLALKPLVAALRACLGWTALPGVALAGPLGEAVQQGMVGVARPDARTTEVSQASQRAVVNWQSFSVAGDEAVKFVQPGADAAILNRVVGGGESEILGRIDANGRVFLVNPQGVYFGAGARVDAAGFAASALDVADDDFMAGRYEFTKGAGATGAVANHGELRGEQFVALLGERVENAGLVAARLGTVALAAGERVTLTLDQSGLVSFAVDAATTASLAGVENTGQLIADGGRVVMSGAVANGLVATAVNNAGLVRARGIELREGSIHLRGDGGAVINSGTLDADGPVGGEVRLTSTDDVTQTGEVSARGVAAGGDVRLIAGRDLRVAAGAKVDVGSDTAGQGGLIEVSARRGGVQVDGALTTGSGGKLVLDPARVRIDAGPGVIGTDDGVTTIAEGFIETQLGTGSFDILATDEIFTSAVVSSPILINSLTPYGLRLLIASLVTSVYVDDPDGEINLGAVNFNLGGLFEARAGSASGSVTLGSVSVRDEIDIRAGANTGNITTKSLSVYSPPIGVGSGAEIRLTATGQLSSPLSPTGIITVNGGLLAEASSSDTGRAKIDITAQAASILGPVVAQAYGNDAGAMADIDISLTGGLVAGSMIASAAAADARVAAGAGSTQLSQVKALASSLFDATVELYAERGLVATGLIEASGQAADIRLEGRSIGLSGGIAATAAGSDQVAQVDLVALDGISVSGPVEVGSSNGGAFASFRAGSVRLRDSVTVRGTTGNALLLLEADGGSIVSDSASLLTAETIGFGLETASAVDVRTKAPEFFFTLGATSPVISLDNTAHTGGTFVYVGGESEDPYEAGPFAALFHGDTLFAGDFGESEDPYQAGPFAALFHGDTLFAGDFSAANARVEVAAGSLHFEDSVLLGDTNLPASAGDALTLQALALARRPDGRAPGLPLANGAPTTGPNAMFGARDGLSFDAGLVFDDPDTPYVVFMTDGALDLGTGVYSADPLAGDFIAQFTTYTPGTPIAVEDSGPVAGLSGPLFTRTDHFALLPGTTLILGNSTNGGFGAAGDITVGTNGSIDIGDQNILFATAGRVTGAGNIKSTGFVGELGAVRLAEQNSRTFPLPFAGDIRPQSPTDTRTTGEDNRDDERNDVVDIDDTGTDGSARLVARRDNGGQMCQ